jgi:hypothetical protein
MDSRIDRTFGRSRGAVALLLLAVLASFLGGSVRAADREPAPRQAAGTDRRTEGTLATLELAAIDDAFIAAPPATPPAPPAESPAAYPAVPPGRELEDLTSLPTVADVRER